MAILDKANINGTTFNISDTKARTDVADYKEEISDAGIYPIQPNVAFIGNYTFNESGILSENNTYNAYLIDLNGINEINLKNSNVTAYFTEKPIQFIPGTTRSYDNQRHLLSGKITLEPEVKYLISNCLVSSNVTVEARNTEATIAQNFNELKTKLDSMEIDGFSRTDKKNLLEIGTRVDDRFIEISVYPYTVSISSAYCYYRVPVIAGRNLKVKGVYGYDVRPVVFINDSEERVGYAPSARVTPIREETLEITIPDGSTYALVTGYKTTNIVCEQDGHIIYTSNNDLEGKKLVSAGDSITEALQADGKSYAWYCAKYYGMDFINIGLSGRTMADCKNENGDSLNGFSVDRYTLVPNDTDVLTIMFGWNDFYYGPLTHKNEYCISTYGARYNQLTDGQKAEADSHADWNSMFIGTLESTDTKTWCGAWKFILNYFTVTKHIERLGVLLPYANPSSMSTDARSKLKELCKQYGVSYLDTMNPNDMPSIGFSESGQTNASALKAQYTTDTTHPNSIGHKRMSRGYITWVSKI